MDRETNGLNPAILRPDRRAHWFLVQIGMASALTARPVSAWLIRWGIKEAM